MSLSRLDIKTLKYDSLYDDTQILLIENIKKVEEVRRERISKLYSEMLDLSGYRVEEGQTDFHALSPRSEHHTHTQNWWKSRQMVSAIVAEGWRCRRAPRALAEKRKCFVEEIEAFFTN